MLAQFLFLAYVFLTVVFALLAVIGYRERATHSFFGYEIPKAVREDAALLAQANRLVAFWCGGAAALSAAGLFPLYHLAVNTDGEIALLPLAVLALYTVTVTGIGSYPLEKVKHLAD